MALRCGSRNGGMQDGGGGAKKVWRPENFFLVLAPPPRPPARGLLDYGYLERASLGTECHWRVVVQACHCPTQSDSVMSHQSSIASS